MDVWLCVGIGFVIWLAKIIAMMLRFWEMRHEVFMKRWFYRQMSKRQSGVPKSPLWVRLLWLIGIIGFCGLMYWRYSVTG